MTDDEARRLSIRCVDAWPNGAKGYIWRDELIKHPYTVATQAIDQLIATARGRPPMPGDLVAIIADLQVTPQPATRPPRCDLCDDTGWVDAAPIYVQIGGEPHPYTTVQPCRCRDATSSTPAAEQLEAF
jgi:hypothetical protein